MDSCVKDEFIRNATLLRVVDGDTIDVLLDLGCSIFKKERVRLLEVDTKEIPKFNRAAKNINEELALEARNAVEDFLGGVGSSIVIKTYKDKTGKYGRLLAKVYSNGVCLNTWLLEHVDFLK